MNKSYKVFYEGSDEINTSEGYRGAIKIIDNHVIIPCINVSVTEHSLNKTKENNFIDYCYLFYLNVKTFHFNTVLNNVSEGTEMYYNGCASIVGAEQFEASIECKKLCLILRSDSRLSTKMWIPIETPAFRPNLDKSEVYEFLHSDINPVIDFIKYQENSPL
ncbi:hypothetical protein [Emticicia sp. C21]|uniref:hypothetical protein n=1 Tax=Emticicia sp. C21 TaxID=2302915 RepID=UPI000E345EFA|nr:hypothetical protein [Emticicia sp. C21]RFS15591.1 hypothetical protein D0T08_15715 [Emticicia sp. C21]